MNKEFGITALAREFDVTTRTLRFYEEKGLLQPGRQGNTRLFSSADRTRLKLILRGKRLGFTLDESSDIIRMYDPAGNNEPQLKALIEKIGEKKARLQQQQQELKVMMKDLQLWESRAKEALQEKTNGTPGRGIT